MTPPPSLQELINTVRHDSPTDGALDQLVTAAAAVAELEDTSDALLGHFVDRCRREGRSWSEISAALGVSKQAVHKRFAATMADQITAEIPRSSFDRFTPRARNVLEDARAAAGQAQVSSAHLLLALFADPHSIAAKVLAAMSVDEAEVRAVVAAGNTGPTQDWAQEFTPDGRQALRDAVAIALELVHNYIGTEHILLALYRNPGSPAAAVLLAAGTTEEMARTQVIQLLTGYRKPGA